MRISGDWFIPPVHCKSLGIATLRVMIPFPFASDSLTVNGVWPVTPIELPVGSMSHVNGPAPCSLTCLMKTLTRLPAVVCVTFPSARAFSVCSPMSILPPCRVRPHSLTTLVLISTSEMKLASSALLESTTNNTVSTALSYHEYSSLDQLDFRLIFGWIGNIPCSPKLTGDPLWPFAPRTTACPLATANRAEVTRACFINSITNPRMDLENDRTGAKRMVYKYVLRKIKSGLLTIAAKMRDTKRIGNGQKKQQYLFSFLIFQLNDKRHSGFISM